MVATLLALSGHSVTYPNGQFDGPIGKKMTVAENLDVRVWGKVTWST
ncbi:hypothetical protein BN77_p11283 [Rhizobium mesoamericanum STM3625]|uniref:Uncharacterized protein n=1 Tax=Rhizobium mesoamericanum STM3625 TaxID=1211777 RepID=K0Q2Y8_9HYPH|nr:hypothetical protein BN77_p11283 [Rhizobium mesoamericanum STM3625]